MVETADELRRGRESYANRAWLDAYTNALWRDHVPMRHLPSGTVSLLFADIEASTRLLGQSV